MSSDAAPVPGAQRGARPASTRPGPASTNACTPSAASATIVSRQRTGRTSAAASSSRGSTNGSGGAREDRDRRDGELHLGQRLAEGLDRVLHLRRVKRAGDVELGGAQPVAGGVGGRGRERVAGAGQDELARGVVVGEGDAVARRDRGRMRRRRAAHDEHRPAAGLLAGDRHQQAAQHDEPQAVALVQRACGDERGQLAE